MPHAVLIAWSFPPISDIASYRPLRVAKTLVNNGWNVTVISAFPSNTIHRMSNQEMRDHIPPDVEVIRLPDSSTDQEITAARPLSHSLVARIQRRLKRETRSRINQIKDPQGIEAVLSVVREIGYPIHKMDLVWHPNVLHTIEKLQESKPIDVLWATIPPVSTGIIAYAVSKHLEIPFILDYRDLWFENPYEKVPVEEQRTEKILLDSALEVSAVTQGFTDVLSKKTSTPVRVIYNGFDPDIFPPPDRVATSGSPERTLTLVHAGTMYGDSRLDSLLGAVDDLGGDTLVHLYGNITEEADRALPKHSKNLQLHGVVAGAQAQQALRDAEIMLIIGIPGDPSTIRGKTFEALALEKPTIYLGDPGDEAARILEQCGVLLCASNDQIELATALRRALNALRTGKTLCEANKEEITKYSIERQAPAIIASFKSMRSDST